MFLPIKSDTGVVLPWEYLESEAAEYQVGQLLTAEEGVVKAVSDVAKMPSYLCMANKTTTEEDNILPVTRISRDAIYETTLSAEAEGAKLGVKAKLSADGLETDGTAGGAFELVTVYGTAKGDTVRGRFVEPDAASEAV